MGSIVIKCPKTEKDGGQEERFIHESRPVSDVDILHQDLQFSGGTGHGQEKMNILDVEKSRFEELLTRHYERVTRR